jgi:peptidyl-dipeptidase A
LAHPHCAPDTAARLNEEATGRALAITAKSHRFDHLQLPPDLRRQIMLLQVTAPAAPKDPKLLAEQSQLAAQLTGMYGKGKFPIRRTNRSAWASTPSPTSWPSRAILKN